MVLQCLTWIPHFLRQLFAPFTCHGEVFEPLSDDVITDILTRLPAKSLLQCRIVSKHWCSLISSPRFAQLHLVRSTPSLFVQCHDPRNLFMYDLKLFIFDQSFKKDKGITIIRSNGAHRMNHHWPILSGSCNGLLLFRSTLCMSTLYVFNPITREEVTLTGPIQQGYLCGIYFKFFNPLRSEYKLLYAYKKQNYYQYLTCNIKENIWSELESFPYLPQLKVSAPAIVSGLIHWMIRHDYLNINNIDHCANAIMVFSTTIESFSVMPHPGTKCNLSKDHRKIQLLVTNEQLCLCRLSGRLVDLWVLEDYEKWEWVSKYKIDLLCDLRRYPRYLEFDDYHQEMKMKILGIQNYELIVVWHSSGLFRYSLEKNSVRKVATKKGEFMMHLCSASVYTKSLVSASGIYA